MLGMYSYSFVILYIPSDLETHDLQEEAKGQNKALTIFLPDEGDVDVPTCDNKTPT